MKRILYYTYQAIFISGILFIVILQTKNLNPNKLFSSNLTYRYQTEAFLKGQLASIDTIFQSRPDYAIGVNGLYQMWGLGTPLIRLPFEIIARLCGYQAFPDLLVLTMLFSIAILSLYQGILRHLQPENFWSHFLTAAVVSSIMLSSQIVILITHSHGVYEEAILVLVLWSLIIIGQFLSLIIDHSKRRYLLIAALSGFAILIRPTGALIGLGVLIAASYELKANKKIIFLGCLIFLFLVSSNLTLNYLRFEDPLEFGYELQVNSIKYANYTTNFSQAFNSLPLTDRLKDTIGAMFFVPLLNNFDIFRSKFYPGEAEVFRIRELYFWVFSKIHLCIFIIPLLVLISLIRKNLRDRIGYLSSLCLWCIGSFLILIYFYSSSIAINSRYWLDFYPTFAATLILAILLFKKILPLKNSESYLLLILILLVYNYCQQPDPNKWTRSTANINNRSLDYSSIQAKLLKPAKPPAFSVLPSAYSCNNQIDESCDRILTYNKLGWDYNKTCLVSYLTILYLAESDCITLRVRTKSPDNFDQIKIKSNIDDSLLMEKTPLEGSRYDLKFCHQEKFFTSSNPNRKITIAWTGPENIQHFNPKYFLMQIWNSSSTSQLFTNPNLFRCQ